MRGATRSRQWAHTISDLQSLCVTKCLVYDDDSPNGDPFLATAERPFDAAATLARSTVALRSLLASDCCPPSFSLSEIGDLKPHGGKATLSTIARNSGESEPIVNEIGKWSGSAAQRQANPHASDVQAASGEFPITAVYSHEALGDGGAVCKIMERQITRIRARLTLVRDDALPPHGGFGYYEREA